MHKAYSAVHTNSPRFTCTCGITSCVSISSGSTDAKDNRVIISTHSSLQACDSTINHLLKLIWVWISVFGYFPYIQMLTFNNWCNMEKHALSHKMLDF